MTNVLVKLDGTTVAGFRAKTIHLDSQIVDSASGEGPGAWREIVSGASVKSVALKGFGRPSEAAGDTMLREAFRAQTPRDCALTISDFGTLSGPFLIGALEYDEDGGIALELSSTGKVTFEAG